jgi:hypothetical protein
MAARSNRLNLTVSDPISLATTHKLTVESVLRGLTQAIEIIFADEFADDRYRVAPILTRLGIRLERTSFKFPIVTLLAR